MLAPVFLDELLFSQLHNASKRGYDVWVLPSIRHSLQGERSGVSESRIISMQPIVYFSTAMVTPRPPSGFSP